MADETILAADPTIAAGLVGRTAGDSPTAVPRAADAVAAGWVDTSTRRILERAAGDRGLDGSRGLHQCPSGEGWMSEAHPPSHRPRPALRPRARAERWA